MTGHSSLTVALPVSSKSTEDARLWQNASCTGTKCFENKGVVLILVCPDDVRESIRPMVDDLRVNMKHSSSISLNLVGSAGNGMRDYCLMLTLTSSSTNGGARRSTTSTIARRYDGMNDSRTASSSGLDCASRRTHVRATLPLYFMRSCP